MTAAQYRYRARFAFRGYDDVTDATVEFTLDAPTLDDGSLAAPPVVTGSFAHPLDGATKLRPFHVLGVDLSGDLTRAFTAEGRWAMIGRLVDLQKQLASEDYDSGEWVTYGVGRCSGLDEAEGPGMYRAQISDESWVGRKSDVFVGNNTTSIWPQGVKAWWRGFPPARIAIADIIDAPAENPSLTTGLRYYRVEAYAGPFPAFPSLTGYRGREITDDVVEWIESDLKDQDDWLNVGTCELDGNFKHLRLSIIDGTDTRIDAGVVGFRAEPTWFIKPQDILHYLRNPLRLNEGTADEFWGVRIWIVVPAAVDTWDDLTFCFLHAPDAPPDSRLHLHLGVWNDSFHQQIAGIDDSHPWYAEETWGYNHPANLTRKYWEVTGERYDDANLYALEQDTSFHLVAPKLTELPKNPDTFMAENVWGPEMLLALKNNQGERKLADLRPPAADTEFSGLTVLDASNSKLHRWRLVGEETTNVVTFGYERLAIPGEPSGIEGELRTFDYLPEEFPPDALDWFNVDELALKDIEGDTAALIGRRAKRVDMSAMPVDPLMRTNVRDSLLVSDVARPFFQSVEVQLHAERLLLIYEDGPFVGNCEAGFTTADTLEEGQPIAVDCGSVKVPNPLYEARFGHLLVIILSITRHPAHAEIEYLAIKPIYLFQCPDPDDSDTWLLSPLNEFGTIGIDLEGLSYPVEGLLNVRLNACKNAAGGHSVDMRVTLVEQKTPIAEWTEPDIGTDCDTTLYYELSQAQQDSITYWSRLSLWISREGDLGGDPSTWRRIEVRRIGFEHSTTIGA